MNNFSPTPEKQTETISDAVVFSRIIAKNFLSVPRIAEDMSIIRRNIQNMIKLRGGKAIRSADSSFVSSAKAETELKAEQQAISAKKVTPEKPDVVSDIMGNLLGGKKGGTGKLSFGKKILNSFKSLFNPKNFTRILGRLAIPLMIFSGLYEGFTSAFDKWKETGSIWETFKAGIGGVVEFFTFGLIDKQMVSDFYDWSFGAIEKVMKSVADFFGFGDVFVEQFAKVKKFLGISIQPKNQPQTPNIERPKESETRKELSKQEVEKLEKEKQYTGKDEIVRKRMGLPEKPASEMETPPSAEQPTKPAPIPSTPAAPTPTAPTGQIKAPAGGLSGVTQVQSGVDISNLNPDFEKRVAAMAADFKTKTGKTLLITSGYRSNEKQKELFDKKVAELGGNEAAARKMVAEPMAPLGRGKGSFHLKGLAVDINSKGAAGLNALAGSRNASTGWLESFGLMRPVANEDWHVQPSGTVATPDNPVKPGAPTLVADKDGKPMDLNTGKKETIGPAKAPSSTGSQVASASTEIAAEQRQQSKPSAPVIVNTTTINNNNSSRTQLAGAPKDNNSTNGALLARAT